MQCQLKLAVPLAFHLYGRIKQNNGIQTALVSHEKPWLFGDVLVYDRLSMDEGILCVGFRDRRSEVGSRKWDTSCQYWHGKWGSVGKSNIQNSAECTALSRQEHKTARIQLHAKTNGAPSKNVDQIRHHNKFKVEKLQQSEHIHGVDAWSYVKFGAIPSMWPECHYQLQLNPDLVLIEDGASPHTSSYTSHELENHQVPNLEWVSNCLDCNPIECIWTVSKRRIQWRCASERVTTYTNMKPVLHKEWKKITVEEINCKLIHYLPLSPTVLLSIEATTSLLDLLSSSTILTDFLLTFLCHCPCRFPLSLLLIFSNYLYWITGVFIC